MTIEKAKLHPAVWKHGDERRGQIQTRQGSAREVDDGQSDSLLVMSHADRRRGPALRDGRMEEMGFGA